jgi:hypothetical protein
VAGLPATELAALRRALLAVVANLARDDALRGP